MSQQCLEFTPLPLLPPLEQCGSNPTFSFFYESKSKVLRCSRYGNGDRMHVILNGEPLQEVDCFKYLLSQVAANEGGERDVVQLHRINEGYKAWRALKSVMSNRGLGIKAEKFIYEGVIVPISWYGSEAWGMRSAERSIANVLQMKCLRSLVGESRMDRVRNEEVRIRAGIKSELVSRADQRVLRWSGHVERMDEYRMARTQKGVDIRSQWRTGTRETEVRLDGWCESGLWQQTNDGGSWATIRERFQRVERPGTYVTE